MPKLHAKLKWATIVKRLNEAAGKPLYRLDDSVMHLYKLNPSEGAYYFISACLNKDDFLYNECGIYPNF